MKNIKRKEKKPTKQIKLHRKKNNQNQTNKQKKPHKSNAVIHQSNIVTQTGTSHRIESQHQSCGHSFWPLQIQKGKKKTARLVTKSNYLVFFSQLLKLFLMPIIIYREVYVFPIHVS